MTHTYSITGMTCTSCQKKVQDLLSTVPGVTKAIVDFKSSTAEIDMSKHVSTATLQAALKDYPKYQLAEPMAAPMEEKKSWFANYKPILLIFFYITAISAIAAATAGQFDLLKAMRFFMAGFFITFSFFKMLDLDGFADSYSMYDIAAKKYRQWGYVYPFVELGLGLAYAANFQAGIVNYITFIVMSVSIVGVLQSVLNKRKIKCACLGAVFNLPMSTVTIVEDILMIAMSAFMIIMTLQ